MDNAKIFAEYPFLKEGIKVFGNIGLNELFTSERYSQSREYAIYLIEKSLGEKKEFFTMDYETKYLGYHLARLILSYFHDPILNARFANFYRDILEENFKNENSLEMIKKISESFSLNFSIREENYYLSVYDYIKYNKKLGEKYRLFYQRLSSGYVYFNLKAEKEKIAKILREAFVNYFKNDLESIEPPDSLYYNFKNYIEHLKKLRDEKISTYTPGEFGEVNENAFPPCIKAIIKSILKGENISHNARFSLVAFLNQIGMSKENILKIFQSVPDFDERMTEYQVLHITGEKGKTVYSTPKCSTMELYNLCVKNETKDQLCFKDWMTHPLIYYKIKSKSNISPGSK
ncbi:MAG: DNA primase [Thermoplasmata archaeon]|nr:DNA primase [Thermoplasmata archaeon]